MMEDTQTISSWMEWLVFDVYEWNTSTISGKEVIREIFYKGSEF